MRGLHHGLHLPVTVPLHLHTGIHSGLVLLDEGDAVSGRMILYGNAVNVAARLCGAANSGEILVSRETLGAESHFFQTDAGDSLNLVSASRTT